MGLVASLRKRWILRSYLRLGPLLVARYGPEAHYSPARVRATLEAARLSLRHLEHASAMFSSPEDFAKLMRAERDAALAAARLRAGPDPYRSYVGAPPPEPGEADRELYERLRAEVARLNGGSFRFVPVVERDFEQWNPISNADAVGSKALY